MRRWLLQRGRTSRSSSALYSRSLSAFCWETLNKELDEPRSRREAFRFRRGYIVLVGAGQTILAQTRLALAASLETRRQAEYEKSTVIFLEIEQEDGIAIARCSGILGLEDAKSAVAALWENQNWDRETAIWVFHDAEFALSSEDVRSVAEFVIHNQPQPPPSKVAFVTKRDADFGMARMFSVHRENPATQFRVFREVEDAMSWARPGEPGAV